jgi:hypothetical protein
MKTVCFGKLYFEASERKWHEDGEICIERNYIIIKIIWVRCSKYGNMRMLRK